MKIDIVSALYGLEPGGAEISTRILVAELLSRGVDAEVVSSRKEAASEPGGAVLRRLVWLPTPLVLYGSNRVTDSLFKKALIERWRERRPDVVLLEDHLSIVGAVEAIDVLRREGQNITLALTQMWEVDSEFFFKFRAWPVAWAFVHRFRVANALAKRMDFVNALTEYMKSRVLDRLEVPADKVGIFHTIALKEPPAFGPARTDRPLLLAPGRINPEKGSLFFLDVVRELARRRRDFDAMFLGGGPFEARVRRSIQREGLTDVCQVTGKIPYETFVKYYGEATAVVAPIMYPSAYTRVVLEALYAGKPIVTFDHGSMPELIANGVTGFLVRPWSVQEFADACERFIDDPSLSAKMSGACRAVAAERADIARAVPALLARLEAAREGRMAAS